MCTRKFGTKLDSRRHPVPVSETLRIFHRENFQYPRGEGARAEAHPAPRPEFVSFRKFGNVFIDASLCKLTGGWDLRPHTRIIDPLSNLRKLRSADCQLPTKSICRDWACCP